MTPWATTIEVATKLGPLAWLAATAATDVAICEAATAQKFCESRMMAEAATASCARCVPGRSKKIQGQPTLQRWKWRSRSLPGHNQRTSDRGMTRGRRADQSIS